jgi:Rps23 Pro-64 3,4-dihydroxylase Tpa1-like proline 4-hydroxylase
LGDDQTIKTPPNLEKILTVLKTSLCSELSSMIRLNGHNEFQLDYYHPNGAHYERHRDALPTDDPMDGTQRRITIIVYLNTDWVSGHGGEVKLYSQLDDHGLQEGADRISKPQLGKVLIMLSGVMDYEVMPTKDKERFALTCWLR